MTILGSTWRSYNRGVGTGCVWLACLWDLGLYGLEAPFLRSGFLLIIPKEHLDRQPPVLAHLEPLLDPINTLNLLLRQLPPVDLPVRLDARRRHALGDHAPPLLQAPSEQHLLRRLAFCLGDGEKLLVGVEGRVGGAEA